MPERPLPERLERLHRALDRVAGRRPAPLLGDPDLDDLVQLAGRLRAELPAELPDPAFRAALGAELLNGPRPLTARRRPQPAPFPLPAALGALAAVLVAAIVVGSVGIWAHRNDAQGTPASNVAVLLTSTHAAAASVELLATQVANTPTTLTTFGASNGPTATAQPTTAPEPTATTAPIKPTATAATARSQPTATQPAPTQEPQATPTRALGAVEAPPVDGTSVELGPGPAVQGGGQPPSSDLTVSAPATLPNFDASAPLWVMATPNDDPHAIVTRVANSLGVSGDVTEGPDVTGRHTQVMVDTGNAHVALTPDTGAFQVATTGLPDGDDAGLNSGSAIQDALSWLATIGYPSDQLGAPVVTPPQDQGGAWKVVLPVASVPEFSLGWPSGMTLTIEHDGRVSEAQGYWLQVVERKDAPLISAQEAVDAIQAGQGYWGGGGIAAQGGSFQIASLTLGYVLTNDRAGQLVIQPVVVADGQFTTRDGLVSPLRVLVRATRGGNGG